MIDFLVKKLDIVEGLKIMRLTSKDQSLKEEVKITIQGINNLTKETKPKARKIAWVDEIDKIDGKEEEKEKDAEESNLVSRMLEVD